MNTTQQKTWTEAEIEALLAPVQHAVKEALETHIPEPSDAVLRAIREVAAEEAAAMKRKRMAQFFRNAVSAAAACFVVAGAGVLALRSPETTVPHAVLPLDTLLVLSSEENINADDFEDLTPSEKLLAFQGLDEPLLMF